MIETKSVTPAERLNLLLEIAHDAQHLKMGTEDKIRVSGKACEEVRLSQ
jgi:inhibitor of growth protein 3